MYPIKKLLATATVKHTAITFSGTILNGALGALFFILLARFLGPEKLGLFSIAVALLTLIADVGDLGTNTGLVAFVGKYAKVDPNRAARFLKLGLEVKLAAGAAIILIGFLVHKYLATDVFSKPELTPLLLLAFVGSLSLLLFSFTTNALKAYQSFFAWSGIQVSTNLVRLVVLVVLFALNLATTQNALLLYITTPVIGFLVGLLIIPKSFLRAKNEWTVSKEFFHYNKWIALFSLIAAFSSRLDTFISARLLPSDQVGLYAAGNQLVQIVPQFVAALGTVLAPKMAEINSNSKIVEYLKKTQLMVLGIAGLGLLSVPFVSFLIPLIYGGQYLGSVPIFIVLLLAMLVFLISVPIHNAILYYYSYPKLFVWLALGHLLIIAIMGWYFISLFGAMGAAYTVLTGSIFNLVVPGLWVLGKIKTK